MTSQSGESLERLVRKETREAIILSKESPCPLVPSLLLEIGLLLHVQQECIGEGTTSNVAFKRAFSAAFDEAITMAVSSENEAYRKQAEYIATLLHPSCGP